ncbi:MAG: DUF58 domain-containing protein [Erysipelotrichaceae bacterium]|nr:DUF58 domain-containing protein [Erysipelotrichaceae bacterium]
MRRNRIILMILWILSLIFITVSGTQTAYGFFILLTMIPFLSLFYIFLVNHYFRIDQHINSHDLIANHRSDYRFVLQNDSFIPFSGIRVLFFPDFSSVSERDMRSEYELFFGGRIVRRDSLICHYRGEYHIGIKAVVIQDFFRLFSFTRDLKRPLFVWVKPDIIRLDDIRSNKETLNTLRENRFKRNVADLFLRDYVPGDDLKFINWKVSAASQKLMVRQLSGEERQGIALIMDSCRYTEDPKEYLPVENKILETVIALDLFFLQKAIPVTVYLEEETAEELNGDSLHSFETNYERLSAFRFSSAKRPAALCSGILSSNTLFNKAMVFLILGRMDPSYSSLIELLRQRDLPLTVVVIGDRPDVALSQIQSGENTGFLFIKTDDDLREVL